MHIVLSVEYFQLACSAAHLVPTPMAGVVNASVLIVVYAVEVVLN